MNPPESPPTAPPSPLVRLGQVLGRVLPWLCVLLPVAAGWHLIREYKVNIPFLDDFMFTDMLEKAPHGFHWSMKPDDDYYLNLHDFFMAQMEHRLAFVRSFIMLRHYFWPKDISVENWFSFALLCGTTLNVSYLLKKTAGSFRQWWPIMMLAGFAIFSPVQYQIVLWPMMFQVACPTFFLSTTLVALQSNLPLWARWLIGVLSALCATLCIASGLLVWMLPVFIMLFGGVIPERARVKFIGAWLAVFAVVAGFYFHDLHNEVGGPWAYKQPPASETMHRNISTFVGSPERVLPFIFRVMGGHLARGTGAAIMDSAFWIGLVSAVLFLAACGWWIYRFKDEALRRRLSPWIAFGSYTLATGLLVCLGRVWATASGDNSISPRYVIHGIPLTISLCALAWIIAGDLRARCAAWTPRLEKSLLAGGVTLAALLAVSWLQGIRLMETWSSARLRMATNTMFFKLHFDHADGPDIDGIVAPFWTHARILDDLHVLNPPMLQDNRLANFKISKSALSTNTARWESLVVDYSPEETKKEEPKKKADDSPEKADAKKTEEPKKRMAQANGFAALSGRKRVADGVFLTYRDDKGEWRIFHVAQVTSLPLYLNDTIARDLQNIQTPGDGIGDSFAAFSGEFALDKIPPGTHELAAWAFDYREQTVYPIVGGFQFDGSVATAITPKKNLPLEAQATP